MLVFHHEVFYFSMVISNDSWLTWKFRSVLPIKARQNYAQSVMMILSCLTGSGCGVLALLFQKEENVDVHFFSLSSLELCLILTISLV